MSAVHALCTVIELFELVVLDLPIVLGLLLLLESNGNPDYRALNTVELELIIRKISK